MNWLTTGPGPANDHWKDAGELGLDGSVDPDSRDLKKLKYGRTMSWTTVIASLYDSPGLVVAKTYTGNPVADPTDHHRW